MNDKKAASRWPHVLGRIHKSKLCEMYCFNFVKIYLQYVDIAVVFFCTDYAVADNIVSCKYCWLLC